ncbi:MAG TPA: AzlC family ABC transporter permease [Beutenbergiaceae bacterium]|nr:AzlC family ABC transporter permease [Beutenbergiaceae bacterium]
MQHSQAEGPFAKEPGAQASGPLVERAEIIRAALGLALYAAAFGLSFGAVAVASGLSVPQAIVLSLVLFSGASQFAFVGVAATGSPFAAIPAALLLGVRNTFYGVTIAQILRPRGWRRVLAAHFSIDETAAMAAAQRSTRAKRYAFWASGAAMFMLWNVGSLAGALLGSVLDTATFGLDAAAPAAFLALLWPALRTARGRWVAAGSVVLALVLIPLVPAGVPVLAAVLVAVAAGWHEVRGSEAGAAHGEGAAAPEGPLGGQGSGSPESPGSGDPQQPRRPGKDDR